MSAVGVLVTGLLIASVGVVIAFAVGLTVRSKRQFAEQNEVVPGRPSPAPASWAGSHSREARLHRRLGDAVRGARLNPRFIELGLAPQMAAIEAQALAIDERLVAASGLTDPHREPAVDDLESSVAELEATIADLVTSVDVADSRRQLEEAVSAADIRLQALAEARAEVEAIDRQVAGGTVGTSPAAENPVADTRPTAGSDAGTDIGSEPGDDSTGDDPTGTTAPAGP